MRKTLLVAASALIIASTANANAMTLGSVRPNIIRAAALGQPDLAAQRTSLTMLISFAASAFKHLRQSAVKIEAPLTSGSVKTLTIQDGRSELDPVSWTAWRLI